MIPSPCSRRPAWRIAVWRIAVWRIALWGAAASLLLLPAIAMLFTTEVRWGAEDFLAFAAMLLVACGLFEIVMRRSTRRSVRRTAGGVIVVAFLLVWAELAVGFLHCRCLTPPGAAPGHVRPDARTAGPPLAPSKGRRIGPRVR